METLNFFSCLQDVLTKSSGELHNREEFPKAFSPFMLCRYLSMRSSLLPYANILNGFMASGLSSSQIYLWAYKHVPRQGNSFIKYISKKKKKGAKDVDVQD